jgi:hypothetical protein
VPERAARLGAIALIALGVLLDFYALMIKSSPGATAFTLFLMLWLWSPYFVCAWIVRKGRFMIGALFSAAMILALDIADYDAVFMSPKHSTAALALFFAPICSLFIFIPSGLIIGWLVERKRVR